MKSQTSIQADWLDIDCFIFLAVISISFCSQFGDTQLKTFSQCFHPVLHLWMWALAFTCQVVWVIIFNLRCISGCQFLSYISNHTKYSRFLSQLECSDILSAEVATLDQEVLFSIWKTQFVQLGYPKLACSLEEEHLKATVVVNLLKNKKQSRMKAASWLMS